MCQITVANLHDERLNKLFFLLAGSIGSTEHSDGWGFAQANLPIFKCSLPLYCTTNSGNILYSEENEPTSVPLLGHIRQASPQVPVTNENAHPFTIENVVFVHNGKLVPKDEKEFVLEEEVQYVDDKTQKLEKKKVKRSDSLIFFEKFMQYFEANTETDLEKKFVKCMNDAMSHFDGKFAMVFVIGNTYFIVRGRTADLYYAEFLGEDNEVLGWVVNTSKKVVDWTTTLMSNLEQLDANETLDFSLATLLKEETIFVAEDKCLREIGKVKETTVYSTSSVARGAANFMGGSGGTSTTSTKKTPAEKYAETVYKFMQDYSLSIADINNMINRAYNCSILDVDETILKHFCDKIIPRLKNGTTKPIRKLMSKQVVSFPHHRYSETLPYPWVLAPRDSQQKVIRELKERIDAEKAAQKR